MEWIPGEVVVMVEKNAGELAGGVEVGPIDSRGAAVAVEDERLEGRIEGG